MAEPIKEECVCTTIKEACNCTKYCTNYIDPEEHEEEAIQKLKPSEENE